MISSRQLIPQTPLYGTHDIWRTKSCSYSTLMMVFDFDRATKISCGFLYVSIRNSIPICYYQDLLRMSHKSILSSHTYLISGRLCNDILTHAPVGESCKLFNNVLRNFVFEHCLELGVYWLIDKVRDSVIMF